VDHRRVLDADLVSVTGLVIQRSRKPEVRKSLLVIIDCGKQVFQLLGILKPELLESAGAMLFERDAHIARSFGAEDEFEERPPLFFGVLYDVPEPA
jgi:hypothetical protein